jgi:hypothetical protein
MLSSSPPGFVVGTAGDQRLTTNAAAVIPAMM